jgi:sortase (surface protein transpeptidase)
LEEGGAAIFNNLAKLHPGDKIYVENQVGSTTTFIVRELRSYNQNSNSPEIFTAEDNQSHLNLITCAGTWSKSKQSYSNRLVVFSDKQ